MPFWWLRRAIGPLKSFRAPARLSVVALICWSVCASLGLCSLIGASPCTAHDASGQQVLNGQKVDAGQQFLAERLPPGGLSRDFRRQATISIAALLILFDCWRTPLPSFDATPPHWATMLRDSKGAGGVVPLPLCSNNWRLSFAMWAQTIHRRPLFEAYLSRAPRLDLSRDPVRSSGLWRSLQSHPASDDPNALLALDGPLASPAQAARDLQLWRRNGARFLIWQRALARPADADKVSRMLERSGRAHLLWRDRSVLLWEIEPATSATSRQETFRAPRL